ncbi:MAG TPA: addiction module protein [Pyrinomonadaceae bacterium]|nr:addiction module protein [Pyrinomonadaceae bacterium]
MDIPSNFEEILKVALSLTVEERAKLIEQLIESLDGPNKEDGPNQEAIDAAWAEEAERRMREIDEGRVELIPGEEVLARLRSRSKQ